MNVLQQMLQRLIHSARVNVFESARFYYWVLVVLTSYFLLNRFLQKLSFVYLDNRWIELKIGEGVLFGLAYIVVLISTWFLRKKIPRYVFWCWGGLVLIFMMSEFQYAFGNPDYSLLESLTKSQGYYTAKFTMPILFWGVWLVLKDANHYGLVFITQLQRFLTINAFFIIAGAVFGVSAFESYPLSGRWGYSGFLWHLSFHSIVYGVFILYLLEQKRKRGSPLVCLAWHCCCLVKKRGCYTFYSFLHGEWSQIDIFRWGSLRVAWLLLVLLSFGFHMLLLSLPFGRMSTTNTGSGVCYCR